MKKQFSKIEILEKICQTKLKKICEYGVSLGYNIPTVRETPLVKPVLSNEKSFTIAEIKRASPTKGNIGLIKQPIKLAEVYLRHGANAISVLCEEDFFKGSLQDLYDIKRAFPQACILRKDFILQKDEIPISYFLGADMVLLIVSIFMDNLEGFEEIYNEILAYNLTPLIEIHDLEEWNFIAHLDLQPAIIGINSRNLKTFRINKMNALKLRSQIPNNIPVIFESGIQSSYDSFVAGSGGFQGILCGSHLVEALEYNEDGNALRDLKKAFKRGNKTLLFKKLIERLYQKNNCWKQNRYIELPKHPKPLVKVCGINDFGFLESALKNADLLGFILVPQSPRYVDEDFLQKAHEKFLYIYKQEENKDNYKPVRVGVITQENIALGLEYIQKGYLDCLQLHNVEFSFFVQSEGQKNTLPYSTVNTEILEEISFYPSVCFDSLENIPWNLEEVYFNTNFMLWDNSAGNAKTLDTQNINSFLQSQTEFLGNLWLAGGICVENLEDILKFNPMLIDVCSGFESKRGVKDVLRMTNFFDCFDHFFKNQNA